MLTEKCRFPKGAIVLVGEDADDKVRRIVRDFVLEEEQMRHTFEVMNDPNLDHKRTGEDAAYYSAAIMAARVKIEGVKVTPETILSLHSDDGKYLLYKAYQLDERREEFRKEIETLQEGHHSAEETRLHHGGNGGDEPGGD